MFKIDYKSNFLLIKGVNKFSPICQSSLEPPKIDEILDFEQVHNQSCKRKVIMSPFSKVEMSPQVHLMDLGRFYEGNITNEHQRG